jgi:hypothetical protein
MTLLHHHIHQQNPTATIKVFSSWPQEQLNDLTLSEALGITHPNGNTVRNVVDSYLLLIYFHLFPSLPPPSRIARHRTRAIRHTPPFHDTVPSPRTLAPLTTQDILHNVQVTAVRPSLLFTSGPPRLASLPSAKLHMAPSAS